MKTIRGKTALVTGAASGIGRAISVALAAEGAEVYPLDVDPERVEDISRASVLGARESFERLHFQTIGRRVCLAVIGIDLEKSFPGSLRESRDAVFLIELGFRCKSLRVVRVLEDLFV